MNNPPFEPAETMHRLVKQALDSGAAKSVDEAEALFRGYRLCVKLEAVGAHDPINQAALLTTVALARRVFLGGVSVELDTGTVNRTPIPIPGTLADAVVALGGTTSAVQIDVPRITIGGGQEKKDEAFNIRTIYAGWRGGIAPAHSDLKLNGGPAMPLAAMLASALAVNEAFLYVSHEMPAAGRRVVGMSLWNLDPKLDWLTDAAGEPELRYLPSRVWLLGLGHLGQSFLWGLGLLPYPKEPKLHLVLQDFDIVTPSTESTSILTDAGMVGLKKTRAMAKWAEKRGFSTAIHERLFDAAYRRHSDEPSFAFCGLDNAVGRQALDTAGFDLVVEAGLGKGHKDFRTIRLHILPGIKSAAELWPVKEKIDEEVQDRVAYKAMLEKGELDRCGVTLLAGKAVGAPFVGAVAATLAISEALRLLQGGPLHQVIDLDLKGLEHRGVVPHPRDFSALNPGYVIVEGKAE